MSSELIKGQKFGHQFVVDSQIYQGFLSTFKDRNELHTSPEFAQSFGFKSVVMHGNILNGFLSFFVGECLPLRNVIIHTQEIKFSKPVFLNDVLSLEVEVSDIFESVGAVEFKFRFINEQAVLVAKGRVQVGVLSRQS